MTTAARRARVVEAMTDGGIDVLVLGREANARYVSGADRLWLAGTRPFAPGCVLPAATGDVHLLSITDDGCPPDIGADQLFPISWNPMNILGNLAAIPGVSGARRVGVDGMTPLFEQLLGATLPEAELVDAERLLRTIRRVKDTDEVDAVRGAVAAAEDALAHTNAALAPGVRELDLKACFEEHMTGAQLTAPALEGVFCVADDDAAPRTFVTDRNVRDGDRVHVRAGVMRAGYEGLVVRTLTCGGGPVRSPAREAAIARCTVGTRVGDLRSDGIGLEGTGLGHEELGDDDVLVAGMTVAVEVLDDGVALGRLIQDGAVVHVTETGPTTLP
jgi:Xaa-Pro aminopeptidase